MHWDLWTSWSPIIWVHSRWLYELYSKVPRTMMKDSMAATRTTITRKLSSLVNLWHCDSLFYSSVDSFLVLKKKNRRGGSRGGSEDWLTSSVSFTHFGFHGGVRAHVWCRQDYKIFPPSSLLSPKESNLLRTLSSDLYSPTSLVTQKRTFIKGGKSMIFQYVVSQSSCLFYHTRSMSWWSLI